MDKCACKPNACRAPKDTANQPTEDMDIIDILGSPLPGILATVAVAAVAIFSHQGLMHTGLMCFILTPLLKIALSHFWKSFLAEAPKVAQEEALLKADVLAHLEKVESDEKPDYLTSALALHEKTLARLAKISTHVPTPTYKQVRSSACTVLAATLAATLQEYSLLVIAGLMFAKHEEVKLHKLLIDFHIMIVDAEETREIRARNMAEWRKFMEFVGTHNSKKHSVEEYAAKVQRFMELKAQIEEKPSKPEE